ncbi:HD2 homeodomain mating-type protein [Mycena indigotica]|uniref:HD2 homeodomain mating-type protein n=1 Tax=Mycena indigotica TaxID=2126181 RepID=A0A8H6W6X0_9AGAR|nr:HD2 homeodomain mating-type protein [Mycena indigotica]KAF7307082.1 HD2 homeodomain mating-type protein [Mycena indigotica]
MAISNFSPMASPSPSGPAAAASALTPMAMLATLLKTANAMAANIKALPVPSCNVPPPVSTPTHKIGREIAAPSIDLPLPPPATDKLLRLGLPAPVAEELSARHQAAAKQLHISSQAEYSQACRRLEGEPNSQSFVLRAVSEHQLAYTQGLKRLEDAMLTRAHSVKSAMAKKDDFNYDFLPVLIATYSRNPKPSRADQLVLAKKSGMSRRQIEVWFQNHRAREKKRAVSRGSAGIDDEDAIRRMEAQLPSVFLVPPHLRQDTSPGGYDPVIPFFGDGFGAGVVPSDDDDDDEEWDEPPTSDAEDDAEMTPPLDLMRVLPDAAPIPSFVELCRTASTSTFSFPAPCWRRTPSSSSNPVTPIDFPAIAEAFAGLHIRGPAPPARSSPPPPAARHAHPQRCAPASAQWPHRPVPRFGCASLGLRTRRPAPYVCGPRAMPGWTAALARMRVGPCAAGAGPGLDGVAKRQRC